MSTGSAKRSRAEPGEATNRRKRLSSDDGSTLDIEAVFNSLEAPMPSLRSRHTPTFSFTSVPVLIARISVDPSKAEERRPRVFKSMRDASKYLCLVYECNDITAMDVSFCIVGSKENVRTTFHRARVADQLMCQQYGPVCSVQVLEDPDYGEQMDQFVKTRPTSFSRWRDRPSSVSSLSSTPSRSPAPEALRPGSVPALRCRTPPNFLRPISATAPSPWPNVDLSSHGRSSPVVKHHVDGKRYILVPDENYVAPPPEERRMNHLMADTSAADFLCSRTGVDLQGGDTDGTSYVSVYKDRERTESVLYGASDTNDVLYRYEEKLKAAVGRNLTYLGRYPEHKQILDMQKTVPSIKIVPTRRNEDLFDNYIAVVLAVLATNSNLTGLEKIVKSVVTQTTPSALARSLRVFKQRSDNITDALQRLVDTNMQSVPSIHTLDSASAAESDIQRRRTSCWASFRRTGLFTRICCHMKKRTTISDVEIPDPFANGTSLLSLRGEMIRQMDRVLLECKRRGSGHKEENLFDMVFQSVWNRFDLTEKIGPTGLRLTSLSAVLVWNPPTTP